MKAALFFLGLLLLTIAPAKAQMFQEGMIITREGDSLIGLVAHHNETTMAYKPEKSAAQKLYPLKEVVGYTIADQAYEQHVVEVLRGNFPERVEAYLKVVVDGPLRLLELNSKGLFGSEHENYYLIAGDEIPIRVNKSEGNFKATMRHYFAEHEELSTKIRKKELGYTDLVEIVNTYNAWVIVQELNKQEAPAQ